jgi:hypothetical protein
MTLSFSALLAKAPAASPWQRAGILAGFAIISALLTTYAADDPWRALAIALDKDIWIPILPGLYFGLALGAAIYLWTSKNVFNVIAVLVVTVVAWIVAHHTAVTVFRYHEAWAHHLQDQFTQYLTGAIDQYRDLLAKTVSPDQMPEISASPPRIEYPYTYAVGGILAGLAGSAITAFGVSMFSANFRTVENWLRTIATGTAAGLLLQWPEFNILPGASLPLLFLVWQPAVAASIGYGLATPAVRAQG